MPPSQPVIEAVGHAGRALPELVNELKTSEPPQADIAYLRGLARALAEFKTEELLVDHTQTVNKVESPYDHITGAETEPETEPETVSADADAAQPEPEAGEQGDDMSFGDTTQVISADAEARVPAAESSETGTSSDFDDPGSGGGELPAVRCV